MPLTLEVVYLEGNQVWLEEVEKVQEDFSVDDKGDFWAVSRAADAMLCHFK
jgi:hypothetical protein